MRFVFVSACWTPFLYICVYFNDLESELRQCLLLTLPERICHCSSVLNKLDGQDIVSGDTRFQVFPVHVEMD